jgi:hypothetical protein
MLLALKVAAKVYICHIMQKDFLRPHATHDPSQGKTGTPRMGV